MLLPMRLADGIRSGEVTLAFRAWKRPTVKPGGTLTTTALGVLSIESVDVIEPESITDAEAIRAGEPSAASVVAGLRDGPDRQVYRIEFCRVGEDPRIALREAAELSSEEAAELTRRLDAIDARSGEGPWTRQILHVIHRRPAVVSTELATEVGMERPVFKQRVRRLKALGLTESLEKGYRLSPRAEVLLDRSSDTDGSVHRGEDLSP